MRDDYRRERNTRHKSVSRLYLKLFGSYACMIVVCYMIYILFVFGQMASEQRRSAENTFESEVQQLGNQLDYQFMTAEHIVHSINTSVSIRKIYQTLMVEKKVVDTYNLFLALDELASISTSGNNLSVYNTVLFLKDYNKAYAGRSVIPLGGDYQQSHTEAYLETASLHELTGIAAGGNILFEKEFLIYGGMYTYTSSGSPKGEIAVLLNINSLQQMARSSLSSDIGFRIREGENVLITQGREEGELFASASAADSRITYEIFVDPAVLAYHPDIESLAPIGSGFLLMTIFMFLAFLFSRYYYLPLGNMEKLMSQDPEEVNSVQDIIHGIENLIGERNGYQEKMITLSPYARQGVLHGLLNGNMEAEQLQILKAQNYMELKKHYFAVAIINLIHKTEENQEAVYRDCRELIHSCCEEISREEILYVDYAKDESDIYLIVNSDLHVDLETVFYELFHNLEQEIGQDSCVMTMGVGKLENDITRLADACADAEQALEGMLTGGRGCVYFYEELNPDNKELYYFPQDAVLFLEKSLKERNVEALEQFLREIYDKNRKEYDLQPEAVRLLISELHIATVNALKHVNAMNLTHIQISKLQHAAPLEEQLEYYRSVYVMICSKLKSVITPDQAAVRLDQKILSYIEEHACDSELSLALLSDQFGVSNKYITILCKNELGNTYLQYVQEKRIHKAAELMKNTDLSMEEVAQRCGYSSILTFRRNFKAIMGMNPSSYR